MLHVKNLSYNTSQKSVLKGLSFSMQKGEIAALIGISGSGKSTLFRLMMGLIEPGAGEILIEGKSHHLATESTSYMGQNDLLLPWRDVLSNLLLFTELGHTPVSGKKEEALELLKTLGLEKWKHAYPNQLSGGMRQRVALARALLLNRPLLLLDEPFSSLDVVLREQLYAMLRRIRDQYGKTILLVTHDFRDAFALADKIFILADGSLKHTFELEAGIKTNPLACEKITQQIREYLLHASTL